MMMAFLQIWNEEHLLKNEQNVSATNRRNAEWQLEGLYEPP